MRNMILPAAFAALAIVAGSPGLAAQTRNAAGFPTTPTTFELPREMYGDWKENAGFDGFGGGNCGSLKDERGNPRETCQFPVDKLEPLMNGRAKAWQAFFDEPLSPRWSCVAGNFLTELGDGYLWNFSVNPDAVLQRFEQSNWTRTIWVDGRPHPPAEQIFYQGHSIGRMDGDVFVVESTNFTFDPDGMDDQSHIATSHLKKVIERYKSTGEDKLEVEITVEDPLFFNAPFTWTFKYDRPKRGFTGEWFCDPEVGLGHLYGTTKQKYPDDKMFEKYK
jgi:hypothetical protein